MFPKKFKIGYNKPQSGLSRFTSVFSGKEPRKSFWALKNVSLSADAGEILGIIGENGAGKTTLLRIIAGIFQADKGRINIRGKIVSLIGLRVGLQERLTMQDNIYLCCALYGLDRRVIKKKFTDIVELAELERFTNTKIFQFSQGMVQRLAFAIGVNCEPKILLIDEVFSVGDKDFRQNSLAKINRLAKNEATVIIASHEIGPMAKICNKLIWLDRGKIVNSGMPGNVVKKYLTFHKNSKKIDNT